MGEIKIINVLKDDSFEEIHGEFKKAEAQEVIFILPKSSGVASHEQNFATLAETAQAQEKIVTLMTADPQAGQWAEKYNFKLLSSPGGSSSDDYNDKEEEELEEDEDFVPDKIQDTKEEYPEENEEEEETDEEVDTEEDSSAELQAQWTDIDSEEPLAELAMAKRPVKSPRLADEKSVRPTKKVSSPDKIKSLESIWLRDRQESLAKPIVSKKTWRGFQMSDSGSSVGRAYWWGGGILVLLLLGILYFTLGSAKIIIHPQKQTLDFKLPITVDLEAQIVDVTEAKLPGKLLLAESEVSQDFVSSGQRQVANKARGELVVYNNFNSETQIFVATTRFESSAGLIYRTPRPISIPGAKLVNGKLVPGSATVEVIADKPGEEYNIGPDNFTVPGLRGSPRFEGFYAESREAMRGGKIGLSKVVTEKDFNSAKEQTSAQALTQATSKLEQEQADWEVAASPLNEIISLKSTAETDDAVEGFTFLVQAGSKNIAFSKKDLLSLIETFISRGDQKLILLQDRLTLDYQEAKIDLAKKQMTMIIVVKGESAAVINEEKIIENMLGMKQDKIKDFLLSIEEVESAKVILSPFWVRSVPKDQKDVSLEIQY